MVKPLDADVVSRVDNPLTSTHRNVVSAFTDFFWMTKRSPRRNYEFNRSTFLVVRVLRHLLLQARRNLPRIAPRNYCDSSTRQTRLARKPTRHVRELSMPFCRTRFQGASVPFGADPSSCF